MKIMKLLLLATLAAGVFAGPDKFGKFYENFLDSDKQMSAKQGQRRVMKNFGGRKVSFEDWSSAFPTDAGTYDVIDRDNDGVIWFQELMAYSKYNAQHPHAHHIAQPPADVSDDDHEILVENMLRQANPNGLPYATTQQFANWRAQETFDTYDSDKNGMVSPMEISIRLFDPETVETLRTIRQNPAAEHNASPEDIHSHPFDRVCRNPQDVVPAPWQHEAMEAPARAEWSPERARLSNDEGFRKGRRLAAGTATEAGCNAMTDGQEHWCNVAGGVVDCTTGNWVGCGSSVWDAGKDLWNGKWGRR